MKFRLWQWLVFFFTRPIRFADLSALAGRMKPRAKVETAPVPAAAAPIEVKESIPAPVRARFAPRPDVAPSLIATMLRPKLEIGVSEQPLDTLPDELRAELQRPSTGRL